MEPRILLMQFCVLDKDSQRGKFTFRLEGYSKVRSYCISPKFWFCGNYWKLQISKRGGYFGMFVRWYGTDKINDNLEVWCNASLYFSVINMPFPNSSISDGEKYSKERFDTLKRGIGYSEIVSLKELETNSGYILDDIVYVQVQIKVYETVYRETLWIERPLTTLGTSESEEFHFYGVSWKLLFFPYGEKTNASEYKLRDVNADNSTEDFELSASKKIIDNEIIDNEQSCTENNSTQNEEVDNINEKSSNDNNDTSSKSASDINLEKEGGVVNLKIDSDINSTNGNDVNLKDSSDINVKEGSDDSMRSSKGSNINSNDHVGNSDNASHLSESTPKISPHKSCRMSAIYLLRYGETALNELRHNVRFRITVNGPRRDILLDQYFYHRESNAYGTDRFLRLSSIDTVEKIKVTVSFEHVIPYFYFGYPAITNGQPPSFLFQDQLCYLWSFSLSSVNNKLRGCLTMDNKKKNKKRKEKKHIQTCWMAELLSPIDIDQSVLFASKSRRQLKDVVFSSNVQTDFIDFPVSENDLLQENHPLKDDGGMLSVRLTVYCCNEVTQEHHQMVMSIDEMGRIAEKIRHTSAHNSFDESDFHLVRSLVDHLDSYDKYIKGLERNPNKAKSIHVKTSISSLIQICRPVHRQQKHLSLVANSLEHIIMTLPLDIEKVLNISALHQGTLVVNNMSFEFVVFLKDFTREKTRMKIVLNVLAELIKKNASADMSDRDLRRYHSSKRLPHASSFYLTQNGLLCTLGHHNTIIILSQGFNKFSSVHHVYKKAGQCKPAELHEYIVMMSYLQLAFINKQSQRCKDLISVVKHWSNGIVWEASESRPNSYLLTLLVIHAFESVEKYDNSMTPSFNKEVLSKFGDYVLDEELCIEWAVNYDPKQYSFEGNNNIPFVRDPALPHHNVAKTGIEDWYQFRRETQAWVKSLTF